MNNGGRAAYIDHEADQQTLGDRAAVLGIRQHVENRNRFAYVEGWRMENPENRLALNEWLTETGPDRNVLIFDSILEAGCPIDAQGAHQWIDEHIKPWRNRGYATVAVDHIPMKKDPNRASGPIGSVRKLTTVGGAAILVTGIGWTKEHSGKLYLSVDKDRHGQVGPKNTVAAIVSGTWHDIGFSLTINKPGRQAQATGPALDHRIVEALADGQAQSGRWIRRTVKGGNDQIGERLDHLISKGLLDRIPGQRDGWWTFILTPKGRDAYGLLPDEPQLTLLDPPAK